MLMLLCCVRVGVSHGVACVGGCVFGVVAVVAVGVPVNRCAGVMRVVVDVCIYAVMCVCCVVVSCVGCRGCWSFGWCWYCAS